MTRPCATPDCGTLTFGEICLGCLQRSSKAHQEHEDGAEPRAGDDSPSD
jgi:hypothetical protein